MKILIAAIAAAALITGAVGSASAAPDMHGDQNMHGDQGQQHSGWGQDYGGAHQWSSGQRIGYNDWSAAQPVDYHQHHLRRPPNGYEWRESNGQYILAAVATGVIASIILSNGS